LLPSGCTPFLSPFFSVWEGQAVFLPLDHIASMRNI
jgi:hypothetical protein